MTPATRRFAQRQPGPAGEFPESLHPVLKRLYLARGATRAADIDLKLNGLLPPEGLLDLDRAAGLLVDAIVRNRRILFVADFDADGATSCALGVRALRAFGAKSVDFVVPNRFEYGYGLTPEIVALALTRKPDILVTVDNGVSSHAGVAAARHAGVDVVITDHHLPGATLPEASAIVNPNQPGDAFASKCIAGVGVIFYVMMAVRAQLRRDGWFRTNNVAEPNLAQWLDLVALGTVADLVPLDRNNRILVGQGLARINRRQMCPGIAALLAVAGRAPGRLGASDLGFGVAPRLNAAGRLTDMALGIECLLTDDPVRAQACAQQLDGLNRERRKLEAEMQSSAMVALDRLALTETGIPSGLCLYQDDWHPGIVGILAARVRERVHRPVIVFAPSTGNEIRGSARSVPGVHVRDVLESVAARHPVLLSKFGGHAMAAGLTLRREDFNEFQTAFAEAVTRFQGEYIGAGTIETDGELAAEHLNIEFAQLLRDGGPWGQGFPEPLFEGLFEVIDRRAIANRHLKLVLRAPNHARPIDAIAFRALEQGNAPNGNRVRIAFRLDINEYLGQSSLQLILEHIEESRDTAPSPRPSN